jgi:hypothetical protein
VRVALADRVGILGGDLVGAPVLAGRAVPVWLGWWALIAGAGMVIARAVWLSEFWLLPYLLLWAAGNRRLERTITENPILSKATHRFIAGERLDEALEGKDAEFVHQSIVEPNAEVAEGYNAGVMPSFQQLSEDQVNDLVAFLTQS